MNEDQVLPEENTETEPLDDRLGWRYDMYEVGRRTNAYLESTELPIIEELAEVLGVSDDTILRWAKKHPEFRLLVEKLKRRQKIALMRNGMTRDKGQMFPKFLLTVNHNMVEKQIIETGDSQEGLNLLKELVKRKKTNEHTGQSIQDQEREDAAESEAT